jgi:VanZ family protein
MSRRATCLLLAVLSLLCVLYGSVVPLRLHEADSWADAMARLGALPFEPTRSVWTGDFFVNVLVFLPVGFFAGGAIAGDSHRGAVSTVVPVALFSVGAAALLEFAQLFVQDRTAAWSDVLALSLGGMAGSVLWAVAGLRTTDWLALTLTTSPERRVFPILAVYSAGWLIVGLLPLLFPKYAYPLVRSVWLGPSDEPAFTVALTNDVVTALAVAPVGAFLALLARRLPRAWLGGLVATGGVATALLLDGVRQVTPFLTSPKPGPRVVGALAGVWIAWHAARRIPVDRHRQWGRVLGAVLAAWCLVLVLHAWAPFDFGVPAAALDLRVKVLYERAPLHRYYWAPPLTALNMALTVFLLALPVGALLSLISWRSRGRLRTGVCAAIATTFFGLLEWGQLYLPAHRADPTDVVIAGVGSLIGAALVRAVATSPRQLQGDS